MEIRKNYFKAPTVDHLEPALKELEEEKKTYQ
jgi:hypothetical protein